ncbi:MAG: hypothetical protein OEM26_04825 [Saprospiraceae bacterium]|nr:hypothetical protein [Saprospiraceae bacterium]
MEDFVNICLWLAAAYLLLGLIFYLVCLVRGMQTIDPDTEGAPLSFRLIIGPGMILMWPALVGKWKTKKPSQ